MEYHRECIKRAVAMRSNVVWRLLNENAAESTHSLLTKKNTILTNTCEIVKE